MRDGFRLGPDDLAQLRHIGGHAVGHREVKRPRSDALGDLIFDRAGQFGAVLAYQHGGQFDFPARPDFPASHGNAIDFELLLGIERLDIEGDFLYLQRVESALQHIGHRYGGRKGSDHGGAGIGGVHVIHLERRGGSLKLDLAGNTKAGSAHGTLSRVDGVEDRHLHQQR